MKKNKAPGPDGIPIEYYKAFFCDPNSEEKYIGPAKCLEIIFNKIWNGSFPRQWNSATIVSIPKKGDLTDCNNYRGISLINVWLKIISKIVTDRITNYALSHNFIRPEQFGFRNHEECISLFITIREICQRRSFAGKFTYVAFLDIKKAYDSVPIFNILTKLFRLGIRGKCFDFLSNLYKSSKARARFLDMLSDEFPIDRGVRQGCPLSPILFNLFINDILNNCEKYGVQIGNNHCCGGLFADDIVLIAPSEKNLKLILNRISKWASINEMTFGIQKCATMVVKPNHFTIPPNYREPLFYINMDPIPQVSCYTYLGIPFSNDLSLDLIIEKMYISTRNSLYALNKFFWNRNIPLIFKKQVLQSFVISKALYYAPLLGSNQNNTKKIQTLINTGMLWCIDSFNKKKPYLNNVKDISLDKTYCYVRNPTMSTYALSREFQISPIAGVCAARQVKCFIKWKNSNCIIKYLVQHCKKINNYSPWTVRSKSLAKKLKEKKATKYNEIKNWYWDDLSSKQGIKGKNYNNSKYCDSKHLIMLGYEFPHLNLGIKWILRLRCGYKYNSKIAYKSNRVLKECPSCCPCCQQGDQSFEHWIFECPQFSSIRWNLLNFINDLFNKSSEKIRNHSLFNNNNNSTSAYKKFINQKLLSFLLGGTSALEELHFDKGERKHLIERLYKKVQ